ncbi:MAG: DUF92 domain-containing protein [Anaerolineales bacterium]|nr:DUF92 domain-containing protein [Anaerolineales bacterium]
MIPSLLLGFALGVLIALASWRLGALSPSGTWAAAITGGLIFGLGGLPWAALLLTFFISSSVLSRLFGRRKSALAEKFSKGSRRDWAQVLANGGLGALLAVVHTFLPDQDWVWLAYAGSMAAVNADTWATELGVLSPLPPRLVTTGRTVERGTSGGVSLLGIAASLAGALLVGLVAVIFSPSTGFLTFLSAVTLGGLIGSLFDSILGATVQAIYRCPQCDKETERHPLHLCGSPTAYLRGWRWMNNDAVNFLCALVGAILAAVLY